MKKTYRVSISSPPDREKLVADISFDNIQWAEINQEKSTLEIEFYPRPDGKPWIITFADAVGALQAAAKRLTGGSA